MCEIIVPHMPFTKSKETFGLLMQNQIIPIHVMIARLEFLKEIVKKKKMTSDQWLFVQVASDVAV